MKSGYHKDKLWLDEFESLGEMLRYVASNTNRRASDTKGNASWYGTSSLDEAVTMGTDGWTEIRPEIEDMFRNMEEHINMAIGDVFQTVMNYSGDSVDMDRYLMGDPECMMDYVVEPSGRMGRVVRVLVNGAASCGVEADQIKHRGVVACALIDVLAKLGVGVEVWLESATLDSHTGEKHSQLSKLHDSEERLDINNLMFALAHPSMLRRVGFSVLEQTQWKPAKRIAQVNAGYGRPNDVLMKDYINADVVIERVERSSGDPIQDGVGFIMSAVKGLQLLD